MKDSTQAMNILEAHDLYQSYNQTVLECQFSQYRTLHGRREGTLAIHGVSTSHDRLSLGPTPDPHRLSCGPV